jgi:hypothetical protein
MFQSDVASGGSPLVFPGGLFAFDGDIGFAGFGGQVAVVVGGGHLQNSFWRNGDWFLSPRRRLPAGWTAARLPVLYRDFCASSSTSLKRSFFFVKILSINGLLVIERFQRRYRSGIL